MSLGGGEPTEEERREGERRMREAANLMKGAAPGESMTDVLGKRYEAARMRQALRAWEDLWKHGQGNPAQDTLYGQEERDAVNYVKEWVRGYFNPLQTHTFSTVEEAFREGAAAGFKSAYDERQRDLYVNAAILDLVNEGVLEEKKGGRLYRPLRETQTGLDIFKDPDRKKVIGNNFWGIFHPMLAQVSAVPTPRQVLDVRCFLDSMETLYPCEECRPGFGWVRDHPPDFASRKALIRWGCDFHNAINSHVGNPAYDCTKVEGSNSCSACSRDRPQMSAETISIRPDVLRFAMDADMEQRSLKDYRSQQVVKDLVKALSAEYGITPPRDIRFVENRDLCPGTSCTIMDNKNPTGTTKIFYNPSRFSLRTTFHEFYHYLGAVLTPDQVKAKLGDEFKGDPDDETEADRFAYHEIRRIFPELKLNSDSTALNASSGMMQELALENQVVRKQGMGEVFSMAEGLYGPIAQFAKLPVADLNLEYTPEIIGSVIEVVEDLALTPTGQVVGNALLWIILGGAASFGNVSTYDRQFLNEWAAHHFGRFFLLANPAYMSAVMGGAKSAGSALGRGRAGEMWGALAKPPETITGAFRSAFASIQTTFAPLTSGGFKGEAHVPSNTTGGGADAAGQKWF